MPHTASRALLLQTTAIPPEAVRLVHCHSPWPTEDVLFCPGDALPAFVTGIPALSSGPELWIAVHNHRPEPLQLHSEQNIGVLEVVMLADTPPAASQLGPPRRPSLPERLSLLHQQQLNALFQEFSDVFSRWSTQLRPMGLRSASPIDGRTRMFDGRRWRRSSRCWPAMSSTRPTVRGPRRWSW